MAERDLYYVALKVFLEHDGNLFIFKDKYGDWDIPGGRIKTDEFSAPLEKVIERKMREELGSSVKCKLGNPIVLMRHERQENGKNVRIFAVGYTATLTGGHIQLSEQHTDYEWVPIKSFEPEKYFTGGWLEGVKEYLAIKRGFQ
ncbi:NUDIX domain-containing protein [archaeon]|nr:MAG: NUDIX domain-containing protein [archaeon]